MWILQEDGQHHGILDEARDEMTSSDGGTIADAVNLNESEHHGSILEDTNLWVLLGFIIVVGLLLSQGVGKKLGGFLTSRAKLIQDQLDEARNLREDAQRLLADYQKRQREAESEAEAIIAQAKADAKAMSAEAKLKIEEQVARPPPRRPTTGLPGPRPRPSPTCGPRRRISPSRRLARSSRPAPTGPRSGLCSTAPSRISGAS